MKIPKRVSTYLLLFIDTVNWKIENQKPCTMHADTLGCYFDLFITELINNFMHSDSDSTIQSHLQCLCVWIVEVCKIQLSYGHMVIDARSVTKTGLRFLVFDTSNSIINKKELFPLFRDGIHAVCMCYVSYRETMYMEVCRNVRRM